MDRHVVQVFGFLRLISRGIDAGKLFEIMDEMRLIEIAAARRHVYPGKLCAGPNVLQHLLKAPNASKELGRESHFMGKELDKAARADTDVIGKISDGGGSMNVAKKTKRAIDGVMVFQRLESLLQQALFKHMNFHFRRSRFK